MKDDFNFIVDEPDNGDKPLVPEVLEDTPLSVMTPRKFGQMILDVLGEIGGKEWIKGQAAIDPRGYMELLKKVLPKTIQAEGLDGLTVILTDQYGNQLEINTMSRTELGRVPPRPATSGIPSVQGSGQPRIATGGNHNIVIKEEF